MAQLMYSLNDTGLFENAHFYRHIMSLSGTFDKKVIGNIVQTPTFHIFVGIKGFKKFTEGSDFVWGFGNLQWAPSFIPN